MFLRMTPLITKTVAYANHSICWRSIVPAWRSRASIEVVPTTMSAYMNASIPLEALGSPSTPSGLWKVKDRIRPGDNAAKIAAGKRTIAVNRANGRQRALGSLPLGNSKSKKAARPRPLTEIQELSQANTSPAGSDPDGARKAYATYSALKWTSPKQRPIAQKSHPMGLSGRRLATMAPTIE